MKLGLLSDTRLASKIDETFRRTAISALLDLVFPFRSDWNQTVNKKMMRILK